MKKEIRIISVMLAAAVLGGCQAKETAESPAQTAVSETEGTTGATTVSETEPESEQESQNEETEKPSLLNVMISYEYFGEWDEDICLISGKSPKPYVLDEGYEALQAAMDRYAADRYASVQNDYDQNYETAKEMYAEHPDFFFGFTSEVEAAAERADRKTVSLKEEGYFYAGGAHGMYWHSGVSFDTESGNILTLSDVITDYDELYEYVKEELPKVYDKDMFFENYEELLEEYFADPDSVESNWYLDSEGLQMVFNPYLLGPYASGIQMVTVPYGEEPGLVKEEYWYFPSGKAIETAAYESVWLDADGDGNEEEIRLETADDPEEGTVTVTIRCGEASLDAVLYAYEMTGAYLLKPSGDRTYLYIEGQSDNDWRFMDVFDLSSGTPVYVDEIYNAPGGSSIMDPSDFILYTRLDALGTYSGYRKYHVGDNGVPEAESGIYEIVNLPGDVWKTITSSRAIPVWMAKEEGKEPERTELPAGTRFAFCRTDGESFVEMKLEDGRHCEIRFEYEDGMRYIEGVDEWEYFENLPYAG